MTGLKRNKLNQLMLQAPSGVVLTLDWLKQQGVSSKLAWWYVQSNWLERLGEGAYKKAGDKLNWTGAVSALQNQLHLPLHVGGLTALQVHGVSQYAVLREDNPIFYLYNTEMTKVSLPLWFKNYFKSGHFEQKKLFSTSLEVEDSRVEDTSLNVSSPERAVLELLALVPNKITLVYANELMENLNRLRTPVVQNLLENCLSIKVKRLFLYLAEKNNLACFKDLNLNSIDLGSGKRVIGAGGHYYEKWQLSVTEDDFDNIKDLYE